MSPKAYTATWLGLLAVPAFVWYLVTLGPVRSVAFNMVTPEAIYLANLREPELACRTLRFRRPEAIVVGDSHTYAAWDFAELERRLGLRLGACALGGLYAETVPTLLDYILREVPRPRQIILGLSPRMFWESPTKQEQVDFHNYLLKTMEQDASAFVRRAVLGKALPRDGESEAIARHASRIDALDEGSIVARLDRSTGTIKTLKDWNARLNDLRFAADPVKSGQQICQSVRASGANLWVLHVPESPYLEARYSQEVWQRYGQAVKALAPCAEKVLLDPASSYGLGNRHYVNRQLLDSHDYAVWQMQAPLGDDLAFDADHLNPVGARFFTRKALERFRTRAP